VSIVTRLRTGRPKNRVSIAVRAKDVFSSLQHEDQLSGPRTSVGMDDVQAGIQTEHLPSMSRALPLHQSDRSVIMIRYVRLPCMENC
jgi:hypothetical protein